MSATALIASLGNMTVLGHAPIHAVDAGGTITLAQGYVLGRVETVAMISAIARPREIGHDRGRATVADMFLTVGSMVRTPGPVTTLA